MCETQDRDIRDLSFSLDLVAIGLVFWLEVEILVRRTKKHFTIAVFISNLDSLARYKYHNDSNSPNLDPVLVIGTTQQCL